MVGRPALVLLSLIAGSGAAGAASARAEASPAPAAETAGFASAEATCREFPGLNRLFRFGAGFRISGPPVVGPDGAIYVGTADGYVHRLHSDGSFHWSYTVKGPVTGRTALTEDGRLLLVPAPHVIYALRTNGSLSWSSQSKVGIQSGFTRDSDGRLRFAAEDGRVLAFSDRGELLATHVPGKARVTAGPVVLRDGLAVGRADGTIQVTQRNNTRVFRRKKPIRALFACPGPGLCAIAGHVLMPVGASKRGAFQMPALYAASAPGAGKGESWLAVLSTDSRLELYSKLPGEPRYRLELPDQASAEPTLDAEGTTYVPLQNGALVVVTRDGRIAGCAGVADSPLGTPVVDVPRRRVLVTASAGELAAFQLP